MATMANMTHGIVMATKVEVRQRQLVCWQQTFFSTHTLKEQSQPGGVFCASLFQETTRYLLGE